MAQRVVLAYDDAKTLAQSAAHRFVLTILDAQSATAGLSTPEVQSVTSVPYQSGMEASEQSEMSTAQSELQTAQSELQTAQSDPQLAQPSVLPTPCAPSRFDIALTGGSDILRMFDALLDDPLIDSIDWFRVFFWWADERFVPADDEQRNALQAQHRFLDGLVRSGKLLKDHIFPMPADDRSSSARSVEDSSEVACITQTRHLLETKAAEYEALIRRELGEYPRFDLLILGMGPDGHYASLFPDRTAINETERLVTYEVDSPKKPPLRLTLTHPMMARSRHTWMLTAGAGKTSALAHVFEKTNNPQYPASFVDGEESCMWFTTRQTLGQ